MKRHFHFFFLFTFTFTLLVFYSCQNDKSSIIDPQIEQPLSKKGNVGGDGDDGCTTIKDGTLLTSAGTIIKTGYDEWGYNYQSHLFNGYYCDAYRDASWCQAYKDVKLQMKWNDAWLSNKDCNGDGLLDRHFGFDSYIGSGAWITNHMAGEYEIDGKICKWNYFVKIVAAPGDAELINGYWFTANGTEIGPVIWNEFAIIQEISNDLCAGEHGAHYLSQVGPGFGQFQP